MKKLLFLISILFLLIPISTYARDEEWVHWNILEEEIYCSDNSVTHTYGTEVTYENGKYTVGGTTSGSLVWYWSTGPTDYDYVYTCRQQDQLECEKVYVYVKDLHCRAFTGRIGLKLTDGETYETKKSFFLGDGYTYEDGVYTLTNPEEHPFSDMTDTSYISDTYPGKVLCEGYGTTCKKAWIITEGFAAINAARYLAGIDVESYFLISDQFKIEDDQYVLVNPRKAYPLLEPGTGYTCHNHDDRCTDLYRITIEEEYDSHDGRRIVFDILTITSSEKDKTLNIKETMDIQQYFTLEELRTSYSTNKEVADIVDNELKIYKVGKTDLVYENDLNYKVVHLTVVDKPNKNPHTGTSAIIMVIVGLLLVFSISFYQEIRKGSHAKS